MSLGGIGTTDAISKTNSERNPSVKVEVNPRIEASLLSSNCAREKKESKTTIEDIFATVRALERSIFTENRTEFDLRMAFVRQEEKLSDLRTSLETEKMRNQRLVQLIRGVDSSSSATEDDDECGQLKSHWPSRTPSTDAFESISPLLMQHRYDELSTSYRQCRRQMAKKDKLLILEKCEKEELQARYDHLLDEFKSMQKRFEELCGKYLKLQTKKNQEIHKLREALNHASRCLMNFDTENDDSDGFSGCGGGASSADKNNDCDQFRQNFRLFVNALRECTSSSSLKT